MLKDTLEKVASELNFIIMYPANRIKESRETEQLKHELMDFKKSISKIIAQDVAQYSNVDISEDYINSIPINLRSSQTDAYIRRRSSDGYYDPFNDRIVVNIENIDDLKEIVTHEVLHKVCSTIAKKNGSTDKYELDFSSEYDELIDIKEGLNQYFTREILHKLGIESNDAYYIYQVNNTEKLINVLGYDMVKGINTNQDFEKLENIISKNLGNNQWKSFKSSFKYDSAFSHVDKVLWQLAVKLELYRDKSVSKTDIKNVLKKSHIDNIPSNAVADLLTIRNPITKETTDISSLTLQQIKVSDKDYIIAMSNENNDISFYKASNNKKIPKIIPLDYDIIDTSEGPMLNKHLERICNLIEDKETQDSTIISLNDCNNVFATVVDNTIVSAYKDDTVTELDDYSGEYLIAGEAKITGLQVSPPISFKEFYNSKNTSNSRGVKSLNNKTKNTCKER